MVGKPRSVPETEKPTLGESSQSSTSKRSRSARIGSPMTTVAAPGPKVEATGSSSANGSKVEKRRGEPWKLLGDARLFRNRRTAAGWFNSCSKKQPSGTRTNGLEERLLHALTLLLATSSTTSRWGPSHYCEERWGPVGASGEQ